jgi:hypothetical protein
MNERDMEDLIAAYPSDFFAQHKLTLKGRQKSFAGVGRFDLLFEDEFRSNILMELKARPAKYEDATQVAKYKEELERQGETNILMWLVAPQVPTTVREFLDRIGIEYSEIHEATFRRVAARHEAVIRSETAPEVVDPAVAGRAIVRPTLSQPPIRTAPSQVTTGPMVTFPSKFRWKAYGNDLALQNHEDFDKAKFVSLIDSFEQAVPSHRNASLLAELRSWADDPRNSRWPHGSNCSLLRWVTTSGWKDAVPHAEAIWTYLFGQPVPTWYVWRQGRKKYEFDARAWTAWYESLARPAAAAIEIK